MVRLNILFGFISCTLPMLYCVIYSPVNPVEVPDYYEIVKDPIDLETIGHRVNCGVYYATLEMFAADFHRMFENCRLYNSSDTVYYKCANRLEQFFENKISSGISWRVKGTGL